MTMNLKAGTEWVVCEALEPGKTAGGLIIPGVSNNQEQPMYRHITQHDVRGYWTAGSFVEMFIPAGSLLIPRGGAEMQGIHPMYREDSWRDRKMMLVHLRDVAGFIPPEAN